MLRVRTAASDEAKVFHTHQLLLSLQSEVFEGLLRNQSVVTLYEPPETAALFEKFIRCVGSPRDGDAHGRGANKEGGVPWGQWELQGKGMPRGMLPSVPQGPSGKGAAGGMEPTG